MLSSKQIAEMAAELDRSEKSRQQVEHFSKRFPGMTVEDGYAISRAWVKAKIAEGRVARGHKIGLTSCAMQISCQIDEPDYGTLLDDMFAPGDIPTQRFIAPRVEVELAFVLKKNLQGDKISIEDVLAATDYMTPAIEIIDARIEQFDRHTKVMRKVQDTISDNAANAGIVLGGKKVNPREVDLPWRGAILRQRRGGGIRPGRRRAGPPHPAVGVAWLAMKLAPWGECLEAGEVVLAGSFTRPVGAKKGDRFDADHVRWAGSKSLSLRKVDRTTHANAQFKRGLCLAAPFTSSDFQNDHCTARTLSSRQSPRSRSFV
jgi:2-oxo-hept-3-ene-1,7-dioate hydratase